MGIREEHDKLREYWNQRARPGDMSNASHNYLTQFYETFRERLREPYMDLGCGSGKFLFRLANDGITDIHGCDISPALVNLAREKLSPFLDVDERIKVVDMLDLSKGYPSGFFKTFIFSGVLQQTLHSASRPVMEEIAKISAKGAIMYFSTRSISTPPKNGIKIEGEKGTFRLKDGVIKSYFDREDISRITDGLFEVLELDEKDQTEKISGEQIKNWEGVFRRI